MFRCRIVLLGLRRQMRYVGAAHIVCVVSAGLIRPDRVLRDVQSTPGLAAFRAPSGFRRPVALTLYQTDSLTV